MLITEALGELLKYAYNSACKVIEGYLGMEGVIKGYAGE